MLDVECSMVIGYWVLGIGGMLNVECWMLNVQLVLWYWELDGKYNGRSPHRHRNHPCSSCFDVLSHLRNPEICVIRDWLFYPCIPYSIRAISVLLSSLICEICVICDKENVPPKEHVENSVQFIFSHGDHGRGSILFPFFLSSLLLRFPVRAVLPCRRP